ncbi:hypothetical protein [Streptomyces buecherae]|uniref:hypothetical protein n=1 Tax=Streptomyces buecherae TaxID=2763006 RepID=UPI0036A79A74
MTGLPYGVRRRLAPYLLLCVAETGAVFAALACGALYGPRWLLLTGLFTSSLTLAVLGVIGERDTGKDAAWPLRPDGPRAYAPALVREVRAVDRATGRPAADRNAQSSVFEFDLTVVPEDRDPYRIRVRHPLDVQDLLHRDRAVVQYDPRQPWRVILPPNPPREAQARATHLDPDSLPTARSVRPTGLPSGAPVLLLGLALAAVVVTVVGTAG